MLSPWSITIIHFTREETAAQRGCSFIHSHTASVIEISCLHSLACNHYVLLSRLRRCSHQKAWYAWFSLALPIGTSQGPRLWLGRSLGRKLFTLSLGFTAKGKHFPSDLLSVLGPRTFLHTKDADAAIIISSDSETVHYHYGPKDLVTILFYIFITIILHAVVQEYILDVSDVSRFWNWGDVLDCRSPRRRKLQLWTCLPPNLHVDQMVSPLTAFFSHRMQQQYLLHGGWTAWNMIGQCPYGSAICSLVGSYFLDI